MMGPPVSTIVPKANKSHDANSSEDDKNSYCDACGAYFKVPYKLIEHIRKYHFNFWATVPQSQQKEINQVWVENVSNSKLVVEIKKTGVNSLLLRPMSPSAAGKVEATRRIDVREVKSGSKKKTRKCPHCKEWFKCSGLSKHIFHKHPNAKHRFSAANEENTSDKEFDNEGDSKKVEFDSKTIDTTEAASDGDFSSGDDTK